MSGFCHDCGHHGHDGRRCTTLHVHGPAVDNTRSHDTEPHKGRTVTPCPCGGDE